MDINKVILIGNVGRDPEIRNTQQGKKIANLSLATTRRYTQNGEKVEKTEWHRVVVFNDKLADVVEKYVQKGTRLYVEGELATRKWTDQSGAEKYTTEIVVSAFRGEIGIQARGRGSEGSGTPADTPSDSPPAAAPKGGNPFDLDDDLPF